jgi:hypothetical protein
MGLSVAAKLGKATIERGDASTGHQQVCYASAKESPATHLIFEFGEKTSISYLSAAGADWKVSRYCVRSTPVLGRLSTTSGSRLGLAASQVEAILGQADGTVGDTVAYFRHLKRKSTPVELEQFRRDYPEELSDARAHQEFDV